MKTMIQSIIIDDEIHAIETLEWKFKNYCPNVNVIATFTDPKMGLDFLEKNKIDLLFLDIEMPEMSGFDLLQQVSNLHFDVILVTAYDEFGIRAIKFSALDYILKPVQEDDLKTAIAKYQKKHFQNILPQQLEVLFQSLQGKNANNQKIALATRESIELVKPSEIIMCESDNNYTMVYLDGRKKFISKTLKDFEELLGPYNFFRTHQSFLVNVDKISEFVKTDGGYLVMKNGMRVAVSRNKKESVLKLF